MRVSLSVAAQDQRLSNAVRRIRPALEPFFVAFSKLEMVDPIHEAILIGLTDSKPSGYFEVIPNEDGFFQVLSGVNAGIADDKLRSMFFDSLVRAVHACPFSKPDKARFISLLAEWKDQIAPGTSDVTSLP